MINSYTEFQPLNSALVGGVFEDSFFDDIANATIREGVKEIVGTTREDIKNFKKILKDRNINIHQISLKDSGYPDSIVDFTDNDGCIGKNALYSWAYRNGLPDPLLYLRGYHIVMGKKILATNEAGNHYCRTLTRKFKQIFGDNLIDTTISDKDISFKRSDVNINFKIDKMKRINPNLDVKVERKKLEENGLKGWCVPNLTRVGKTLLVDVWQTPNMIDEFLKPHFPEYNFKKVFINKHNLNSFSIIRPGLVLASSWFNDEKIFPKNWDIIWFDDDDWKKKVLYQLELKRSNNGILWYPEKKDNPRYEKFIIQWLKNENYNENLFDVKVLMLDENTCVISAEDSYIIKELEKRNIEVLYIPFRNRYFWDRGWHHDILDIDREGDLEDYGL